MGSNLSSIKLLEEIVDRVNVGVFVVNKNYELILWNSYMENYSQHKSDDVIGKNIFKQFPELPTSWLEQKIHNVFVLKNFSFTSWEHRPYLFKFLHNRPITGGIDYMRQNCTFLPIKGESEEIEYVCVTLFDVTDTSIYENMLKNAVKSLAEASNRDGLTNIFNRRFLEQSMSKEFARIKRYGGKLSFIIIDLDHFKVVNDTYGHLAGDEILKISAQRLSECLRTSDSLARYGGEEFAVLLPETPLKGADILANRLCKSLSEAPIIFNGIEINVTASLGVSELQDDMEKHEQLISHADDALYMSKDNGRNQVTLYDSKTGKLVTSSLTKEITITNTTNESENRRSDDKKEPQNDIETSIPCTPKETETETEAKAESKAKLESQKNSTTQNSTPETTHLSAQETNSSQEPKKTPNDSTPKPNKTEDTPSSSQPDKNKNITVSIGQK